VYYRPGFEQKGEWQASLMSSFNVPDTSVGFLHSKKSVEFVLLEDVLDATMMSDNESLLIALVRTIYLVLR
jgi:hypothetical protein